MIPQNLSVSDQHQGRAGRAGQAARYFLLVEASVFQKINPKKRRHNDETLHTEDTDEDSSESEDEESADTKPSDVKYRKKVDDSLRKYIETTTCRRDIADKYFGNPPRPRML